MKRHRPALFGCSVMFACALNCIAPHSTATAQSRAKSSSAPRGTAYPPAFQAAFSGDLAHLKKMFPDGVGIDIRDKDNKTLLHYAVLGGRTDVVRWLVAQKVPLNAADTSGVTALAIARRETQDADLSTRRAQIMSFLQDEGALETAGPGDTERRPAPTRLLSLPACLGKGYAAYEAVLGKPSASGKDFDGTWHRYTSNALLQKGVTKVTLYSYPRIAKNPKAVTAIYITFDKKAAVTWQVALGMISLPVGSLKALESEGTVNDKPVHYTHLDGVKIPGVLIAPILPASFFRPGIGYYFEWIDKYPLENGAPQLMIQYNSEKI